MDNKEKKILQITIAQFLIAFLFGFFIFGPLHLKGKDLLAAALLLNIPLGYVAWRLRKKYYE